MLAVNSTYSGTTTISGGTLQLGDGVANNGSVASNIADNAVLTFANPNAQTYTGAIGGNGALIKTGTGALTLKTATNTYSGATTVSAGTLIGLPRRFPTRPTSPWPAAPSSTPKSTP